MRIATWNLERGGRTRAVRRAQEEAIRDVAADVLALTEPDPSLRERPGVITSPPRRRGPRVEEAWAGIVGESSERVGSDLPYERMAVAARVDRGPESFLVYCSVLPWLSITAHAPELLRPGETSLAAFERVLREQVADIAELRRRHGIPVIWAGDFNQSLAGPVRGGATVRRELLADALASLGLTAWNGTAAHASSDLCAVDLICGPEGRRIEAHGRIDPRRGDIVMSDHAGYWVDF